MAQITINIPDAKLPLVLDGWAIENGYLPVLVNGTPNPESKRQFFERTLKEHVAVVARKHYVPPDVGIT